MCSSGARRPHFTSFSHYIPSELMFALTSSPGGSKAGPARSHPTLPQTQSLSAPYLDKHFLLVHGSHDLSHI